MQDRKIRHNSGQRPTGAARTLPATMRLVLTFFAVVVFFIWHQACLWADIRLTKGTHYVELD